MAKGVPALHPEEKGSLDISPKSNWVQQKGGLPAYVNSVANALVRGGMTRSRAIATAVNVIKKTCATGFWRGNPKMPVSPAIRAAACSAASHWEAMKLSETEQTYVELSDKLEPTLELAEVHRLIESAWDRAAEQHRGIQLAQVRRRVVELAWNSSLHPRGSKGTPQGGRFVRAGDSGAAARKVQRKLKAAGRGMSTPEIKRFQRTHGLQVDGVVGRQTLIALNAATATNAQRRRNLFRKARQIGAGALTVKQRRHLRGARESAPEEVMAETKTQKAPSAPSSNAPNPAPPNLSASSTTRKQAAAKGQAMKGGRFPIRNHSDLRKAVRAVGRARPKTEAEHQKVRRHIIKRANAIGGTHLVPDNWAADGSLRR
jgi:hypothetical protein